MKKVTRINVETSPGIKVETAAGDKDVRINEVPRAPEALLNKIIKSGGSGTRAPETKA